MHASVQNNEKASVLQVTVFSPLMGYTMDCIGFGSKHRFRSWIESSSMDPRPSLTQRLVETVEFLSVE